jgi:hypothetical protein
VVTRDLIHSFYNNQLQINGGRNDGFVAWGDSGALVMGHYGDGRANLRLWNVAREFTLCDNFFMGAFGGSFLNHQYLVAATPPFYPDADKSPAKDRVVKLDPAYSDPPRPLLRAGTASAMDGPVRFVADRSRPITARSTPCCRPTCPPIRPTRQAGHGAGQRADPAAAEPRPYRRPADEAGVDWAWYAGGWAEAWPGAPTAPASPRAPISSRTTSRSTISPISPPAPRRASAARRRAGRNRAPITFWPMRRRASCPRSPSTSRRAISTCTRLFRRGRRGPPHRRGHRRAAPSPQWDKMLVVITFDENGGWWDHVPRPRATAGGRARAFPR